MKIQGKMYKQSKGVVLSGNFVELNDFKQMLIDTFTEAIREQNKGPMTEFITKLNNLEEKIISKINKLGKNYSITQYEGDLIEVYKAFDNILWYNNEKVHLGGTISLLTTFNFNSVNQKTYYLERESDLNQSYRTKTSQVLKNSTSQIEDLLREGKKIQQMNDAFKNHLLDFYNQLQSEDNRNKQERQQLYIWAYKYMKDRFIANKKRKNREYSLAKYFWGNTTNLQGYVSESFGTHLALVHPNFINNFTEPAETVIKEHGGFGSENLFELLQSAKGNTSALLSGDIVVIDLNGQVIFNIQNKASLKSRYNIKIQYKKIIQSLKILKDLYENYIENRSLNDEEAQKLFDNFSTTAWVEIQEEINKNGEKIIPI